MKLWIFLLLTPALFALYNGNPSLPNMPEEGIWSSNDAWWGIKLGYEWDRTFDKKVKVDGRESSIRERFDTYKSLKNQGTLTFNASDRFELYGKLGVMKIDLAQRPTDTVLMEYQTNSQFMWGVGGRIILVYWDEMVMGFNALYSGSFMRIDRIFQNGGSRRTSGARFKYAEWQLGVSFSREIGLFIPYVGLAYASMHSNLYNVPNDPNFSFQVADEDIKTGQPFLLLIGVGLTKIRGVSFNLESRMIGERAITLNGNIRF